MEIQISVQNPQKAIALLEFLKSFEMIDTFKILENSLAKKTDTKKETSFFDQFYGSVPDLDVAKFETYLTESRNEWERPLF
ncbi:hypothetical protein [Emticicia sp.]|uniref:hypothetical protein n=1 Tax=Emticicia sp. TaxID=1930953 RepID=UPI0037505CDD